METCADAGCHSADRICRHCGRSRAERIATRVDDGSEAAAFAEELRRRGEAARALSDALVTEVPLLYGSPDSMGTDPGIVLAEIHREAMVRRSGGGMPPHWRRARPEPLPFEHGLLVICVVLMIARFLL